MPERAGYRLPAFDFRGFGESTGPGHADFDHAPFRLDVLGAVHSLRNSGAKTAAVIGGSFGAEAAADCIASAKPGEIDCLVELGAAGTIFLPKRSRSES